MTRGEFEKATRRALFLFDSWDDVTGFVGQSSYRGEIEAIIRDAVDIGARAALGLKYDMVGDFDYENDPCPKALDTGEPM